MASSSRNRSERLRGGVARIGLPAFIGFAAAGFAAAGLALTGCSGQAPAAETAPKARRVILIVCDTLRADRLGSYGDSSGATPNLDAFALAGTRYARAYAQSSKTIPSMAALLSGRPVDEIGVGRGNRFHVAESVDMLAEKISRAGITAAAVVSNPVLRQPDPERLGTRGIAQGFHDYDDEMRVREKNRSQYERLGPETTATALDWVDATTTAGNDEFFLWVHYIDPHGPYTPPDEYARRFESDPDGAAELPIGAWGSGFHEIPAYQALDDERRPAVYIDRYHGEISFVDDAIGDLLEGLGERDLLDDALVVFTADHGESLGEQGWWFSHGYHLHESNIHVPLIVRFPAGASAPRGRVIPSTVQHLDVASTILDAFGLRPPDDPRLTLFEPMPAGDGVAIQQMGEPGHGHRWTGITSGRWQLVTKDDSRTELYDLASDPAATVDVAETFPEVVGRLSAAYEAEIERLGLPGVAGVPDLPDNERRRAELKSLGYGGE